MREYIIWMMITVLVLAALFGVRAWFGYRRIERDAAEDWDYKVSQKMEDPNLTKEGYTRAYKRAYAPRRSLYFSTTLTALVALTPVALVLLNGVLYWLWRWDQTDGHTTELYIRGRRLGTLMKGLTYEPGNMVYGFIAFFGMAGIWAGICAVATRMYHRRAPGLLRDEITRERMR